MYFSNAVVSLLTASNEEDKNITVVYQLPYPFPDLLIFDVFLVTRHAINAHASFRNIKKVKFLTRQNNSDSYNHRTKKRPSTDDETSGRSS